MEKKRIFWIDSETDKMLISDSKKHNLTISAYLRNLIKEARKTSWYNKIFKS